METKICSNPNCIHNGEPQPLSNFYKRKLKNKYGTASHCKDCSRVHRKKYRLENIEKEIEYKKQYREKNKDEIKQYRKEYRQRTKEHISKYNKEYMESYAKYNQYIDRIEKYEECRQDLDNPELIQVRCKYCGRWFNPSNRQIIHRIGSITGVELGEQNFYCSEGCKRACPIYNQTKYFKGFKQATSREVQPELRKMVLERDNLTCQKCNKTDVELHCHHIESVSQNPIESADIDNCITLCKDCHKWVHKNIPGCGYQELRCK